MKTRHIILGLGLLGAALTAVVGGIGVGGLRWVGSGVDASTTATLATQAATMGDMMHEGLRGDVFAALYQAQNQSAEGVAKAQQEAREHGAEFIKRVSELRALDLPPEHARAAAELAPIVQRYADMGVALTRQAATDAAAARQALPAFEALFEELATVQDALIESIEQRQVETRRSAESNQALALRAMLAAALLGTLGLLAVAVAVARHLMRTLGSEPTEVRRLLHRVAEGDLSVQVPCRPDDQHSVVAGIAEMVSHLRATVNEVRANADGLSGAASQVQVGSADLADRTSEQAASLEASMDSIQRLAGLVDQSSGHARQASVLVREATAVAGRSGDAVRAVVQTMDGIQQSSRRINEIIGVIDGIAFQTNILALNAAVEAARAGEQGRGFAVVAGEVRALAQRSAAAAQEIKTLIGESVGNVEAGSHHVSAAGESMSQLVGAVDRVATLVEEMATAGTQQGQDIGGFVETVRRLEDMTQQNAALVEQSAAAAGSLTDQASRLNAAVHRFRT